MDAISKICRLCLNNIRRTYSIRNTMLQTVWERLTNLEPHNIDGGLFNICYICCAQLRRCHDLMQRAAKAEQLFKKYIIDNHFEESKPLVSLIVSKAYEIDYNYAIEQQYNFEFKCGGSSMLEEDNIYVKEEIESVFIQMNEETTLPEELDAEESTVKEDIDSPDFNYAEVNDDAGTKRCSESDNPFKNTTPKRMFQKEIQIVLPRIDKDDTMRNSKNVSIQSNPLPSELINEKGLTKLGLSECVNAVPNTPIDKNGEGNTSNICTIKGSEKEFSCDICHYKCAKRSRLNVHLSIHTGEKPHKCDLCDFICLKKKNLNQHKRYEHKNEKNFSCHVCEMKFVRKGDLKTHLRIHTGEKPYKCDLCDYSSSQKGHLIRHIRCKHTMEKKFSCSICSMKYVDNSSLKIHVRKHTDEKSYKYKFCDFKVLQKGSFISHVEKINKNEKKFSCHICSRKFVYNSNLKTHLKVHTGEKPYKCNLCDYKCSQRGHLIMHMKYKHTKEKNVSCHICSMKFIDKSSVKSHLRIHTGEKPYKCNLCDYRFSVRCNLARHLKYKHRKEKKFL